MFQPAYTMLGHNWLDERGVEGVGYIRAVGTLFPRELTNTMPDMERLIRHSFEAFAEANKSQTGKLANSAVRVTLILTNKAMENFPHTF